MEHTAVSTPRKLPGAVSMFGGIDPFAVQKLKSPSRSPEKDPKPAVFVDENDGASISKGKDAERQPPSPVCIQFIHHYFSCHRQRSN